MKDPWGKGKGLTSHGGTKTSPKGGRPAGSTKAGSISSIAKASGRSKSSTDRDLRRGKALGTETLTRVSGTSLGTGPELDALEVERKPKEPEGSYSSNDAKLASPKTRPKVEEVPGTKSSIDAKVPQTKSHKSIGSEGPAGRRRRAK